MGKAGFRPASLDAVNPLLADVRGAWGSYLNVFLVTQQHWSRTEVGWDTTTGAPLHESHSRHEAQHPQRCRSSGVAMAGSRTN